VPGFHALATERPELRWDYFVQHFTQPALASEDEKYEAGKGIFYPRASAIGGCTAHHAMITVYPDPSDWDHIANITNDVSWSSDTMWRYFERCTDDHGYGWLTTQATGASTALSALRDHSVTEIVFAAVVHAPHLIHWLRQAVLDPPDNLTMFSTVRALFLTHLHSDHVVDYPNLLLYGWLSGPLLQRGPEILVFLRVLDRRLEPT